MTDHILPHNHGEHLNTKLLIDNIAKTEDFQIVADLFKVLGDNSRVRIFWLLCHCEECVINISSMMDMSSPAVSHHLRQLKVKNIRYYKSQPWSFSDTILMGFYCDLDGEEEITLDREELALAEWFRRDEIPVESSRDSLTNEMIIKFKNGEV